MTDQEKLSGKLTGVDASGKRTSSVAPYILKLTDLKNNYIASGSVVEISDFILHGSASPGENVEIRDRGISVASVPVNIDGDLAYVLHEQHGGFHEYTIVDREGRESRSWEVIVDYATQTYIESVKGPDGEPIADGSSTSHTTLYFLGRGVPGHVVEVTSDGTAVRLVTVDDGRHWSANLTDLKPGRHDFTARELNGKESPPWRIEIEKPALLSIQFGLGQGNYQLIKDGETTNQTSVLLVGTAKPNEEGKILSDVHGPVDFQANGFGIINAIVEDLAPGYSYTFVCRSGADRTSEPFTIKVASSELP